MTRGQYIERIRRQIYGGQPPDDAQITENLVNLYLNDAVAVAAKQNYTESVRLDGIAVVNNSFYTTYRGLPVIAGNEGDYQVELPHIPAGLGSNEGVASVRLKDGANISYDCIPLQVNQVALERGMRKIPNKVLYWYEGEMLHFISPELNLTPFTVIVRMVSGGNANDLDSTFNVPDDYFPVISQYIQQQLMLQRNQPQDTSNDGVDNK